MKTNRNLTYAFARILVGLLSLILAIGGSRNANASMAKQSESLSDGDKAQIIRQMLEPLLSPTKGEEANQSILDLEDLRRTKGGVVLSTKNIKPHLVLKIPGVKLLLRKPGAIQKKADSEGDFLYLVFNRFEIKGSKLIVTLTSNWAKSRTSKEGYLSGGSMTYEFKKSSGKWVGTFLKGFIS